MKHGEYVIATKYSDGSCKDQWCIGYFDRYENKRYYVINSEGKQFRSNGFRRCEVIDTNIAKFIIDNIAIIEHSNISIWDCIKDNSIE